MRLIDWFRSKKALIDEKMESDKEAFKNKKNMEEVIEKLSDITSKYIKVLEEKAEGFDLYIEYQKQNSELLNEKKELKKEVAILTEKNNTANLEIEKLTKQVEKLEKWKAKNKKD